MEDFHPTVRSCCPPSFPYFTNLRIVREGCRRKTNYLYLNSVMLLCLGSTVGQNGLITICCLTQIVPVLIVGIFNLMSLAIEVKAGCHLLDVSVSSTRTFTFTKSTFISRSVGKLIQSNK